jgi:predicted metal-dependent enzyme (double-stranded beta helix superfamily)
MDRPERKAAMLEYSASLRRLVSEARKIARGMQDDEAVLEALKEPVRAAAVAEDWVEAHHFGCDEEQGFGVHLLHEEPDHRFAMLAVAWLPGRGTPAHDHGTWAVVAGVSGAERNRFWRRADDGSRPGYAEIHEVGEVLVEPGQVLTMLPREIHSVANDTAEVSLSLHVYGMHPNHTARSQFDPSTSRVQAFRFKQQTR